MTVRRFLIGAPWLALAALLLLMAFDHVRAAPAEQRTAPAPVIYWSGDVMIQRVRHEPDGVTCYLAQNISALPANSVPPASALACLRDNWVYFQDGAIGSTQALKGWVYFP